MRKGIKVQGREGKKVKYLIDWRALTMCCLWNGMRFFFCNKAKKKLKKKIQRVAK